MTRTIFAMMALISFSAPAAADDLTGHWVLHSLGGQKTDVQVSLDIDATGRVHGQAPCNRYFATIDQSVPEFALSPIGATRMACPDLGLESRYFEALGTVTDADVSGKTLTLGARKSGPLVFKAGVPKR